MHLTITNPASESMDVGILGLADNTSTPPDLRQAREYPISKFVTVHGTGNINVAKLSVDFSFAEIMSRKNSIGPVQYNLGIRNAISGSANIPINYCIVAAATSGTYAAAITPLVYSIRLELRGEFTDRIDAYPSLWIKRQEEGSGDQHPGQDDQFDTHLPDESQQSSDSGLLSVIHN